MENMVTTDSLPPIVCSDLQYIHNKIEKELAVISGSRLLLTGAGGFLGYYLLLTLLSWNEKNETHPIGITALSRFKNGIPAWLVPFQKRKDLTVISSDIVKDTLPNTPFDYIIHAASFASPKVYRKYPIETINANVLGLYKLLNEITARKASIKKLLYFSSSEIYGDPTAGNIPTPEDYRGNVSCTGPRACYDESKRFCETLCVNYVKVHSLPLVIARPFNNYGPGMKIDDGRVIADFAKDILVNRDIVMYSNGSPSRTYCYVADAVTGYIKMLVHGKPGEPYNIGIPGPEVTVMKLAQTMKRIGAKHFGYTGAIRKIVSKEKEYLVDNPERRCPDTGKAEKQLGYNPSINLEDGLYRSLQWYKQVYIL